MTSYTFRKSIYRDILSTEIRERYMTTYTRYMRPYDRAWDIATYTEYMWSYYDICQGGRIPDAASGYIAVNTSIYLVSFRCIWILATPISTVGPSISSVIFDIEDFDIDSECPFDIDHNVSGLVPKITTNSIVI